MKKNITFGLQVFTTLFLFLAIFVTYLERKDVQTVTATDQIETTSKPVAGAGSVIDMISNTFTTSFSGVVSCGK